MDSESKVPNIKLRYQRELRGWSQKRLADQIDTSKEMVSKWEGGQNPGKYYQEKLCNLFGKSAQELGFLPEPEPDQPSSLSPDNSQQNSPENNDLQETDRLIVRKLARVQNWIVESLEDGTRLRWQCYYTSSNSLTEDGLLSQIARLEQLAVDGGDLYQRVCRILAQNYQLAGSLARDRFRYAKSIDYFQKAEQLDADIQLSDLTATAIVRQAVALLRKDQKRYLDRSRALCILAVDKAKHAEPYTQAYVLSKYAEVLARKGNYDECIESLDQAETLLGSVTHVPIEEDFAYVRFTLQSLTDSRGECYVLLGKPEQGLEYLLADQKKLDQKMSRNSCRLLMQQSEAYLAAGKPDTCVQQALKGLEVARLLESTSNVYWASEILAKLRLSAFGKEAIVDELQEAIRG